MAIARWTRRTAPTRDWAGAGIALNSVAPAMIATPMAPILTDELRREQHAVSPLGGIGSPEHVASLLAWLTSEENGFVSGQVVFADGAGDALARPDAALFYAEP
jgi:NAD(P)-dependent dehydrogenase (short-subunit alcohol dehydrogenase family)